MLPTDLTIYISLLFALFTMSAAFFAARRSMRLQTLPTKKYAGRKSSQRLVETLEARQVFDASGVELEGENLYIGGQIYENVDMVALAKALGEAGAVFYGAGWCPHCTAQKEMFGEGGVYLPFQEVTNPNRTLNELGEAKDIARLPTWDFADGSRVEGTMTIAQLVQKTGITVPTSTDPYFAEIDPISLYAGEPLFL
ncbi:MAG: hypothetical protein ACIALR_07965, partial [Blastopirellula sp. JB062]